MVPATAQGSLNDGHDPLGISEPALPNREDTPSQLTKRLIGTPITLDILRKLLAPKGDTRLRFIGKFTSWMAVPEAAMNHEDRAVSRQDDVWSAWEIGNVEPEAITGLVQQRP